MVHPPGTRQVSRRVAAMRERLERRRARLAEQAEAELDLGVEPPGPDRLHVVVEQTAPHYDEDRGHPVPRSVRAAADWSWRLLVVAAAVALIGWLALRLSLVVFPVAAGLLLAALLYPVVAALRRAGWPHGLAAGAVFVGFVALVVTSLFLVGGQVGEQFAVVGDRVTEGIDEVKDWLTGPPLNVSDQQLEAYTRDLLRALRNNQATFTAGALSTATIAVEFVTGLVLALFALLFFLVDGARIWAWAVRLFPRATEPRIDAAGRLAWRTLTAYIRGTVLVALFDGFFVTVVLLVLGVPLAVPLGVLVFFGAFVPLVGAFVTGAIAVLVALVTNGPVEALLVLGGIVAVQQLEGHIFQPFVLGRMVRLHPLGVVVAIAVGVVTAGIIGAIVAVPIVAVTNVVIKYLVGRAD